VLQVQALSISCLSGILSFLMGSNGDGIAGVSYHHAVLVILSSMLCAAISSAVLGITMCYFCIICRRRGINPDNVATPIAASFGDLVTLYVLAFFGHWILPWMSKSFHHLTYTPTHTHLDTWIPTIILITLLLTIPICIWFIKQDPIVKDTLSKGWVPILLAMAITSLAGLVLERYIDRYTGLALFVLMLTGITGNLACIYASRISTALHARQHEHYWRVGSILFLLNLPVQLPCLAIMHLFHLDHDSMNWTIIFAYALVSIIVVSESYTNRLVGY
jgi:cation transporter-like permease